MCNLHWCYTFCTSVTLTLHCSHPFRIEYFFHVHYYIMYLNKVGLTLHMRQVVHQARAYHGFNSMKQLRVSSPGWNDKVVQCRATPSIKVAAGTHFYTWRERGKMRAKYLAQEHNTMSPVMAQNPEGLINLETSKLTMRQPCLPYI